MFVSVESRGTVCAKFTCVRLRASNHISVCMLYGVMRQCRSTFVRKIVCVCACVHACACACSGFSESELARLHICVPGPLYQGWTDTQKSRGFSP